MKKLITIALFALLSSCASSTFYREGKPIAHFEGDMRNVHYKDGDTEFTGDIDHSTPTKASWSGATGAVSAAGVVATTSILKR